MLSDDLQSLEEQREIGRGANRLVEDARALEGAVVAPEPPAPPLPDNVTPIDRGRRVP